jgi:hypothetical protein
MHLNRIQKEKIYSDFYFTLKNSRRFFCQHDFINILEESFSQYSSLIGIKEPLFRARRINKIQYDKREKELSVGKGKKDPFQGFSKKDSFVPPTSIFTANRANTNGIPCLYVARSEQTAIAEVRPFKETKVSVAEIILKKPLKLFRFNYFHSDSELDENSFWEKYPFWYVSLTGYFSQPFEKSINDEYLITQCVTEYIRLSGKFDGLLYGSSLDSGGENIVIFNCKYNNYEICEPVNSKVYSIEDIKVEYKPC